MADRPTLAEDLIFGAERIGAELGVDGRQAFTLITRKIIPAFKIGGRWAGRRSAIHQRIAEIDSLVEWQTKEISSRFQAAIREQIEADYPALLAGEAIQPPLAVDRGFGELANGGDAQKPAATPRARRPAKSRSAIRPSADLPNDAVDDDLPDDAVGDLYVEDRGT